MSTLSTWDERGDEAIVGLMTWARPLCHSHALACLALPVVNMSANE